MEKKNIFYYLALPYNIHIQAEAEGGYFARVEELKGCMTQGESLEEVARNIQDAMKAWLPPRLTGGSPFQSPSPTAASSFSAFPNRFIASWPKMPIGRA